MLKHTMLESGRSPLTDYHYPHSGQYSFRQCLKNCILANIIICVWCTRAVFIPYHLLAVYLDIFTCICGEIKPVSNAQPSMICQQLEMQWTQAANFTFLRLK
jgi:hypothetical protein